MSPTRPRDVPTKASDGEATVGASPWVGMLCYLLLVVTTCLAFALFQEIPTRLLDPNVVYDGF